MLSVKCAEDCTVNPALKKKRKTGLCAIPVLMKDMVSSRQRGRMYERMCVKQLIKDGFSEEAMYLVPPSMKFSPSVDVYHCFDILCIHPQTLDKYHIQVTTSTTRGRLKKLREFKIAWLKPEDKVQLWVKQDRGWKIYDI